MKPANLEKILNTKPKTKEDIIYRILFMCDLEKTENIGQSLENISKII